MFSPPDVSDRFVDFCVKIGVVMWNPFVPPLRRFLFHTTVVGFEQQKSSSWWGFDVLTQQLLAAGKLFEHISLSFLFYLFFYSTTLPPLAVVVFCGHLPA